MIELVVEGSKATSTHNFKAEIEGLTVIISPGRYIQNYQVMYQSDTETHITVNEPGDYYIWITQHGFQLMSGYDVPLSFIDMLMWFTATETDLINVHFVKVVDKDAG